MAHAIRLDESIVSQTSRRFGGALLALGLKPSDRLAVLAGGPDGGDVVNFVAARDAATALGLYFVPINPKLAPPEIEHILSYSRAKVLLVAAGQGPYSAASRWDAKEEDTLRVMTFGELDRLGSKSDRGPRKCNASIGATILFTSGTTGKPKACLRNEPQETVRAAELIRTYGMRPDDVHLIGNPLAHSAPGILLRACRSVGAATVILPRFAARSFLRAIEEHKATVFFLVPTQVERLLALPADEREAFDMSSVRAFIVAGAPFCIETKKRLLEWIGPGKLWEFYGSSETGTISVVTPEEQPGPPGGVGRLASDVQIKILDDDGDAVPGGEVGEIWVRSPSVMQGYLGDPVTPFDGYVTIGDLGRMDERGRLSLVDRKNDVIISGGINVYPAEVEQAISAHPHVAGAVCFSQPDPDWGEAVCGAIALRHGHPIEERDLIAFLRKRIASFKIPKRFVFVTRDELPMGVSGKPQRRMARARWAS